MCIWDTVKTVPGQNSPKKNVKTTKEKVKRAKEVKTSKHMTLKLDVLEVI